MNQKTLISTLTGTRSGEQEIVKNIFLIVSGTVFIALMANIKIVLPFTPVPITGGTFAIMLVGLTYGKKLAPATLLAYIIAGSAGLPVFAGFKGGLTVFSPSGGYIIGYFFAALICGYFADRGWTESYSKTVIVLLLANIALYTFGLFQLSFFIGDKNVFMAGLYPFIPGDIIKMALVTLILPTIWKSVRDK